MYFKLYLSLEILCRYISIKLYSITGSLIWKTICSKSYVALSSYVRSVTRKALELPWRAQGTVRGGLISRAQTNNWVFQMGTEHELV